MSQQTYAEWLEAVRRKAARHSLLFVQLGAAHEPARRALSNAGLAVLPVKAYLQGQVDASASMIVVDEIETLISPSVGVTMGELRERVFTNIDSGKDVILLARAPRAAFPAVPGSSLLDDATFVHGPREDMTDHTQWPTCQTDGADAERTIRSALRELGPEICASVDRVIFDCLLLGEEAIGVFTAREQEALEGAGFISLGASRSWNFPRHLLPLKNALADVLADEVKPQVQLSQVSGGLWEMERLIRRAVRTRAVAAWGDNWRAQCLDGDLPNRVLGRATDSAYPGANSIKLLRDPLEWLSLGELLDLRVRKEIGNLGLEVALWRQFAAEVVPIRNRIAHVRTLHPGDSTNVLKWLRVLELKLT